MPNVTSSIYNLIKNIEPNNKLIDKNNDKVFNQINLSNNININELTTISLNQIKDLNNKEHLELKNDLITNNKQLENENTLLISNKSEKNEINNNPVYMEGKTIKLNIELLKENIIINLKKIFFK